MANDWIKMRTDLATSPKVVRIASALKADRLRVIGGLHAVWSLFDTHSVDGILEGYTPEVLDDLIGFQGFSAAMMQVDWLEIEGESVCTPRFDRHNGQSAKRRATETERKRTVRKMSADDVDKMRSREEKRRSKDDAAEASSLPAPAEPEKPKPARRGERLADDWTLPDDWRAWCQTKRPELNPDDVALTFSNYWRAKVGKDATKLDWRGTWQNWVLRQEPPPVVRLVANGAVNNFVGGK